MSFSTVMAAPSVVSKTRVSPLPLTGAVSQLASENLPLPPCQVQTFPAKSVPAQRSAAAVVMSLVFIDVLLVGVEKLKG